MFSVSISTVRRCTFINNYISPLKILIWLAATSKTGSIFSGGWLWYITAISQNKIFLWHSFMEILSDMRNTEPEIFYYCDISEISLSQLRKKLTDKIKLLPLGIIKLLIWYLKDGIRLRSVYFFPTNISKVMGQTFRVWHGNMKGNIKFVGLYFYDGRRIRMELI